jgi:DNA-binding NarL/FixJ family response regulator
METGRATDRVIQVLIVDDAASVREALRWVLESEPDLMVVGEAADGESAIARASELRPDAVLLDIRLPYLDGYAVARALKAAPRPPVVILMTPGAGATTRQRALAAGGDGCVDKGAGWPALLAALRSALAASRRG